MNTPVFRFTEDNPLESILWHDYETWGVNPMVDRPVQFAALRTDLELNIIDDPCEWFCRPALDVLPHPAACVITGITPGEALQKGLCEADFIRRINQQMMQPGTCTAGYNSIRFDDEVTRHTLYRNLLDPYAREWRNGNSRWDLIDIVRLTRALRPDGIHWPEREDGSPSFRLEELSQANGLEHASAHDALSDVQATIELARLIRDRQPKLFDFAFSHRRKQAVLDVIRPDLMQPFVHVSGRYPAARCCLAVAVLLGPHPNNPNGYLAFDLSEAPEPLIELDEEEIHRRLFTSRAELPDGVERIPVKTIHINKAPVVAPLSVLRPQDAERLGIDIAQCQSHLKTLMQCDLSAVVTRLHTVLQQETFEDDSLDPELMLYRGDFFSNADRQRMQKIHETLPEKLAEFPAVFDDQRLVTLFARYRARNYPDTLSDQEKQDWLKHCAEIRNGADSHYLSFADFDRQLQELREDSAGSQFALSILETVEEYAGELKHDLHL